MAPFSLTPAPLVDPGDAGECWRAEQASRFRDRVSSLAASDAALAPELLATFEAVLRETEALSRLLEEQRSGERAAPWWADGEYDASLASARNGEAVEAFARGDAAAALTAALEAVRLDPAPAAHHDNAAAAALALGRPEVALEEARRAVERDPRRVTARERAARALAALGRFDQAAKEAEMAAEVAGESEARGRTAHCFAENEEKSAMETTNGIGKGGLSNGKGPKRPELDDERNPSWTLPSPPSPISSKPFSSPPPPAPTNGKALALRRFARAMRARAARARAEAQEARLRALRGSRPAMPLRLPSHDDAAAALEAARVALMREPNSEAYLLASAEAALGVGADGLALSSALAAVKSGRRKRSEQGVGRESEPTAQADDWTLGEGKRHLELGKEEGDAISPLAGWDVAVTLAEVLWRLGHLHEARRALQDEADAWRAAQSALMDAEEQGGAQNTFGSNAGANCHDTTTSAKISKPEKAVALERLLDELQRRAEPLVSHDVYFLPPSDLDPRPGPEGDEREQGPDQSATAPTDVDGSRTNASGRSGESSTSPPSNRRASPGTVQTLLDALSGATQPSCPLSAAAPGLWASALRGAALILVAAKGTPSSEAIRFASDALVAAPEAPASHATMAAVLHAHKRHTEAYLAVREALRFSGLGGREGDGKGDPRFEELEAILARAAERTRGRDLAAEGLEEQTADPGSTFSHPASDAIEVASAPAAIREALQTLFEPDGAPTQREPTGGEYLSFALVRAAFKRQAAAWHPDRWPRATDEERTHAEERFKTAGSAFELVERWARDEGWIRS